MARGRWIPLLMLLLSARSARAGVDADEMFFEAKIRPVLAGDTISYSNEVETKRTSEKRPQWGILQARNTGINQRNEVVFSFLATAFVPRRNPGS